MKTSSQSSSRLFCFSPLVMISTFTIEIFLAVYIVWKYGFDRVTKIASLILINLAIFQVAEYMVCEGALGLDSLQWARLGYVAITLLPPLGVHLGLTIAKKRNVPLLVAAYGSAAVFSTIFLFVGSGMQGETCLGNYVIFSIAPWAVWPYVLYYYGWLATGLYVAWKHSHENVSNNVRQALKGLAVGYLLFIVPTTAAVMANPELVSGIPSIMCGFAVLLAFTLAFWVLPAYKNQRIALPFAFRI